MKLVLDTNVFIAAYFNRRSASARIIDLCFVGEHQLVFSSRLRKEAEAILKNVKANPEFVGRLNKLFADAHEVKPKEKVWVVKEDPDDNKFLECAFEGKADYIITSDRHLLELGEFARTKICKPTQFLKVRD